MTKVLKAGLLIVTLVIPALIFTFLQFFGTNHYNVSFYHPQVDSSGKVVVANGDTVFYKVTFPQLKTVDKKPFPEAYLEGGLTVVSYLPGACSDSCKIGLSQLERIYGLTAKIEDLKLLTLTESWPVNNYEFPNALGQRNWKIGVFSESDRDSVLKEGFLYETRVPNSKTNSTERKLILIDGDRHIRGYYIGTDSEEIDRLMAEIKILDYEKKNKE